MTLWESIQWLGKNIVQTTGKKKLKESMGSCTGRRDITERPHNQSFNDP